MKLYDLLEKIVKAVNERIKKSEVKSYITSTYREGGWDITKYSDGTYHAIRRTTYNFSASSFTSWGSLYYAKISGYTFPNGLEQPNHYVVTCHDAGGRTWCVHNGLSTGMTDQVYAVTPTKPSSSISVTFEIQIWKK